MNSNERILHACKNVTETCKDAIKSNLRNLIHDGFVKLTPEQIAVFNNMINSSVDEGFERSKQIFNNVVSDVLASTEKRKV